MIVFRGGGQLFGPHNRMARIPNLVQLFILKSGCFRLPLFIRVVLRAQISAASFQSPFARTHANCTL